MGVIASNPTSLTALRNSLEIRRSSNFSACISLPFTYLILAVDQFMRIQSEGMKETDKLETRRKLHINTQSPDNANVIRLRRRPRLRAETPGDTMCFGDRRHFGVQARPMAVDECEEGNPPKPCA
jgi:hypothetical protein